MGTRKWFAAVVGAVIVGVIGVGAVMAQSSGDGTGTSFLDRVAQKLGIQRSTLDQAIKDARSDEIDEKVAAGDLTQEQADALKNRLENMPEEAPFFHGPGMGPHGFRFKMEFGDGHFGLGFGFPGLMESRADLAAFLGISEDQLGQELTADGATLAKVAEAHGKSRDDLKAFINDEAKKKLDKAVAGGALTQDQADNIAGKLSEHIDDLIDHEMGAFRPFRGHHDDGDDDDGAAPDNGGSQEQRGEFEESFRS